MSATATQPLPTTAATLPAILLRRAAETPDAVALRKKHLGRWREYTWAEYAERAARIGLGLRTLGVEPGDRVAVHAGNRPAWPLADIGIQGLGAVTVGVYPTSASAEVRYLLDHSGSKVIVVEDEEQFDKIFDHRHELTELSRIVVIDPKGIRDLDDPMVMTFAELEQLGVEAQALDWERSVEAIDPAELAVLVYTSGTTGPPKGAMISHLNMAAAGGGLAQRFDLGPDDELLSYLPLCHILERLLSVINAITHGYVVNFGETAETFASDLAEVQPTFFAGVPRIWERMMASVEIRMGDASRIKRASYEFWRARGRASAARAQRGESGPLDPVIDRLGWFFVFRSLRDKLGLGRIRGAISGAAPIAPAVLEFFWALGVPVLEGYGMTENTAQASLMPSGDVRMGTVGTAIDGVEIQIADDGEILTRGAGTFLGYYRNPEASAETVDPDGWLHTGDIGELDSDGYLTITDRKKDIIITAGGKNISPSEIENLLKVSPFVQEAVVIGDKRKFVSALVGIELDTVSNWATRAGIGFTTYEDLATKPEVVQLIDEAVAAANAQLAQVEQVKVFRLLPKQLDADDGELTATQKVKRGAIAERFGPLIEGMYSAPTGQSGPGQSAPGQSEAGR